MFAFLVVIVLGLAVFFAVKFMKKKQSSTGAAQAEGQSAKAPGRLPFDLEPGVDEQRFVLVPRTDAGQFFVVADAPFAVRQFGRTVPVHVGSLVFHDADQDGAATPLRRARVHILEKVAGQIWRDTIWCEERVMHSFLEAADPDTTQPAEWVGDVIYDTAGEFRGGSLIATQEGWTAGLAPDAVEGKAHSALTSQAQFAAEQERGDSRDPYWIGNPALVEKHALIGSNSYSARAIAISIEALAGGASDAVSAEAGSSQPVRDFPVQTGRLLDPLGVRTTNFYVSSSGEWTMRLVDGLSLSDEGFVTRLGDFTIGPKGITTEFLGMEVNLGGHNPFDTKAKEGKRMGLLGLQDDTEMTLLGPRKKKKKDERFTFKW